MSDTFSSLINTRAKDIERPKPLPTGAYEAVIQSYEFGQSSKAKTDYARFELQLLAPLDGVDMEEFEAAGGQARLGKFKVRDDFYITEAAIFRLREFMEIKLGMDLEEGTIKELLPNTIGLGVVAILVHTPGKNPADPPYVNVGSYLSTEEASNL